MHEMAVVESHNTTAAAIRFTSHLSHSSGTVSPPPPPPLAVRSFAVPGPPCTCPRCPPPRPAQPLILTAKKGHDRVLAGQVRAAAVPSIFSVTPSRGARQLGASPKSRRNKSCRPRTQNAQQSISATVSVTANVIGVIRPRAWLPLHPVAPWHQDSCSS
eukprot:COSAG06_NODE_15304_length_1082_cov_0.789420_1_plen_159_part_00